MTKLLYIVITGIWNCPKIIEMNWELIEKYFSKELDFLKK
jgi:hypothetical protein